MIELCVCGYYVYKDIWEAAIGKELPCERETRNTKDKYAIAVKKDGMVVRHYCCGVEYLECYKFHLRKYLWSRFNCEFNYSYSTLPKVERTTYS